MDRWDAGDDYEIFMGRWSRLVAGDFVTMLDTGPGLRWLDVGCGTGALLGAVVATAEPATVTGVDPSEEFLAAAGNRLGEGVDLRLANGEGLPFEDGEFDVVVSGLALNFIPDPLSAVAEWARVAGPGSTVAAYVWDYSEGMEFLRRFWDSVIELDPTARSLDEAIRFPICRPDRLTELFQQAGLESVAADSIEVATTFTGFEDYWAPFLRGQGPAPGYVASLSDDGRSALRERIRVALPHSEDGTIELKARAWTVIAQN